MAVPPSETPEQGSFGNTLNFFFSFLSRSEKEKKKRFPEGSFLSLHASFVMDLREAPSLNDGSFTGNISGWSNPGGPTVY